MVHNIIITQQGWTDVKVETSLPNWSIRGLRFRCNEVQDTVGENGQYECFSPASLVTVRSYNYAVLPEEVSELSRVSLSSIACRQ